LDEGKHCVKSLLTINIVCMYCCRRKVIDHVHIQTSWKLEAGFKPMQNPLPVSHSKVCPGSEADTDESNLPKETVLHDDEHPLVCNPSGGGPLGEVKEN